MTKHPTLGKPVHRVFVTRELPGTALQRLAAETDMHVWTGSGSPDPETLRAKAARSDGLLCLLTDTIDEALLGAAPSLKVVSSMSVGIDHVDVAALSARGIPLGYTPGVLVDATADLTFALLLSAARRLPESQAFLRSGKWTWERRWEPDLLLGRDLTGATLGLIGLGAIGQAVARRAQGFGLRVLGWTPSGREVPGVESASLDDVVAAADFLSLHLALTESTRHIINAQALQSMKPGAILINTARGPLVDEAALVEALKNQTIGGAALDVFDAEPVGADHPLLALPSVVAAPHIGSATLGTRSCMANLAVDNLLAGLRGEPMPHCVNPEVLS